MPSPAPAATPGRTKGGSAVTLEDLQAELDAIGRPRPSVYAVRELAAHRERARQWDLANPEAAARWRVLAEQVTVATRERETQEREAAAVDRRLRTQGDRLARSGVGERSLAAAVDPQPTEALSVVQRWRTTHELTWLALCGPKGTGKSVAATWAVREAIRGGSTAAFRRASELAKLSQFEAGAEELDRLKRVHLLVLDDFGAELLTDFAKAQLHELLDHRHENYGRTILTSNLRWQGPGGMAERLGERLVDRIGQAGRCVQLSPANSLRRRA